MQILFNHLKLFPVVLMIAALQSCGGADELAGIPGAGAAGGGDDEIPSDGAVPGEGGGGVVDAGAFSLSVQLFEDGTSIASFAEGELPDTNTVSSVSAVQNAVVAARVVDSSGNPVQQAIVNFSATAGNLNPSTGGVLTNANGVASATLSAGDAESGSAGVISAELDGFSASLNYSIGSVDLQLGRDSNADNDDTQFTPADFVDGEISSLITLLSPGGSTELEVVVVDTNGDLFESPVTVNFTSPCTQLTPPLATIAAASTVAGRATTTYEASGCEGTDNVVASLANVSGVTATLGVEIASADVNSIVFVSATPQVIALTGAGGVDRPEFSELVFRVDDTSGQPAQGETVTFNLTTDLGGITLTDTSGITNADGEVSVGVNSGAVPTPVSVTASLDLDGNPATTDDIISTVSDTLVINTGLPDNNSFSLSSEFLNPGGFDIDGVESTITVRAADPFNNEVPEGTSINFLTEYGRIDSSCNTADGDCSVTWNSQDPRTPDLISTGRVLSLLEVTCDTNEDGAINGGDANRDSNGDLLFDIPCLFPLIDPEDPDFPGQIRGGFTTVLATAIGEETFIDSNSNGLYDDGEPFVDLAEAFLDHNDDGVFGNSVTIGACTGVGSGNSVPNVTDINDIDEDSDTSETIGATELCASWQEGGAEEEFVDFNSNGIYDYGNGIYNGSLCRESDADAGICTRELVNVRDSVSLNAGDNEPFVAVYLGNTLVASPPTLGGSVDVTNGSLALQVVVSDRFNSPLPFGTTIDISAENCELGGAEEFAVPNSNATRPTIVNITLSEDSGTSDNFGEINIDVSLPARVGGGLFGFSFGCQDAD